mmetsp:Transcript_25990/g.56652  ORF Transcript_25990/g.56652 Transcript_25990/m.56652 type:complete len:725 (+) Transcript_25990:195-2369(+)|eukprot:CAMPEP_0202919136 /NCGR_PEP_ID=MMETSP1392-20130828/75126_1 /ASSEMBLY_ACC=CAM_ASM_000868 /TAXON_ID=225041 /ORGANISM="Chlamydomonas chlamydogama, Strain SAG 11-48b" /LENGTH=724 /DNA_ID=CAMNT_0049612383 /DNA_START=99 /DNA_END=2273 /DNA_ORIENTATION=-
MPASHLVSRQSIVAKHARQDLNIPRKSFHVAARPVWLNGSSSPGTTRRSHITNVAAPERATLERAPLGKSSPEPLTVGSNGADFVINLWPRLAATNGGDIALEDPHRSGGLVFSYRDILEQMCDAAAGLRELGLAANEKVSLFSENSSRWITVDQAIMLNGSADCVRGSSAPQEELAYILTHSQSSALVVQDVETLTKMAAAIKGSSLLKFVVVLWGSTSEVLEAANSLGLPDNLGVHSYEAVLELGRRAQQASGPFTPPALSPSSLATVVYTSGTSGHPKGVMLTHSNLMYQINNLSYFLPVHAGQSLLSLLPPWHIYERSASYYILSHGVKQVYSNIRKFKDDLPHFKPNFFVCVPLVLDTLHSRVMQKLHAMSPVARVVVDALMAASLGYVRAMRVVNGVALQHAVKPRPAAALLLASITALLLRPLHMLASQAVYKKIREAIGIQNNVVSGGGSLAPHLDDFYEAIGLQVLNGWGLSETSPVLACRRAFAHQNVRGSVGLPTPGTQLQVVDPNTLADLPDGQQGLVLARGPGVMAGYLDDEVATAKAFRAGQGWFDTGDLGWRAPADVAHSKMGGMIVLSGRAKDTIVLSSGKKVEPEPIEGACCSSPYIKHMILLGQDKRELGAMVFPDEEALQRLAQQSGSSELPPQKVEALLVAEVARLNAQRGDYHPYEHVAHIAVVSPPLSVEDGTLTRTMKPRRNEVAKRYAVQVDRLLHQLRG